MNLFSWAFCVSQWLPLPGCSSYSPANLPWIREALLHFVPFFIPELFLLSGISISHLKCSSNSASRSLPRSQGQVIFSDSDSSSFCLCLSHCVWPLLPDITHTLCLFSPSSWQAPCWQGLFSPCLCIFYPCNFSPWISLSFSTEHIEGSL